MTLGQDPRQGQLLPQAQVQSPTPTQDLTHTTNKVSLYSMIERIHSIDVCPPPTDPSYISHLVSEFEIFYVVYADALGRFFESTWYERNKPSIASSQPLLHLFAAFHCSIQPDYPHSEHAHRLEVQLLWALATQIWATQQKINTGPDLVPDDDEVELGNRVRAFDAMMSGSYLAQSLLLNPGTTGRHDHQKYRQFSFWHRVSVMLTFQSEPDRLIRQMAALDHMREFLDGRENRDVLYSIALLRSFSASFGHMGVTEDEYKDEKNPKHRWAVAARYLQNQIRGGSTAMVRRFCDVAYRAFVNPGFNCDAEGL